jgi:hypothetical protein
LKSKIDHPQPTARPNADRVLGEKNSAKLVPFASGFCLQNSRQWGRYFRAFFA